MTPNFLIKIPTEFKWTMFSKVLKKKKRDQFVNNGWKELRSVTKLNCHLNYGNETTLNIPPFWSVKSIHLKVLLGHRTPLELYLLNEVNDFQNEGI